MLEHRLTDIEDPAIQILGQLANYVDVQGDLIENGHIKDMVSLMKSRKPETSSGAILAMLSILPHSRIRYHKAIEEDVVVTLVNHLKHQKKSLFAAYAFSRILDYDNIRTAMIRLSAPDYIISAVKQGLFNATVENEPGKEVLGRLMSNDELRAAVLKAHTTAALCTMFKRGDTALNHAAFDFLDIVSDYPDGKELIKEAKIPIFRAIVAALDHQKWASQSNAAMALHTLFGIRDSSSERTFVSQEFRSVILEEISQILKLLVHDRSYRVVGGAAALLALSDDETVRTCVREHRDFKFARSEHFSKNRKLQYHGSDPREEDVHKMLDRLFAAMEESPNRRGAPRFPEVHSMPARSPLVTSLAILSCIFYIPCGLTTMLAGWAIDEAET
ncbi:uncharacterized protein F5891DRAFT_1176646 [Suillus fuscotomentosus]|uniref:Uncharacterized protein n=1 Tax=Suillus fuscotomentosus TaxID=1912939 RepID=A0AAD4DSB5_9AGAM|nr:uncharacterized protein F5891DRAFT_1176646 [Suillus fuscotomentosus]KAG1892854.1 hypothetical protein F5891DRAFT_1176646 [Suillus fuscotomentosus]